jgi:hypothetical protein
MGCTCTRTASSTQGTSETERAKYTEPLGHVVLKICLNPLYGRTEKGRVRVTSDKFNHGNCVTWMDEVHSTEERLHLWSGNCLCSSGVLADDDLKRAEHLLDEEMRKRSNPSGTATGG